MMSGNGIWLLANDLNGIYVMLSEHSFTFFKVKLNLSFEIPLQHIFGEFVANPMSG